MGSKEVDTYAEGEAARRAEALARAVPSMPPRPQKDVPRKRPESKRKVGQAEQAEQAER
jgi:hypothetical protein